MCSYIITSPDDITGSWETRKRQFGEGVSWGVSVLEFQTDDSNARIYTHGSGENAPKSGPPKGN